MAGGTCCCSGAIVLIHALVIAQIAGGAVSNNEHKSVFNNCVFSENTAPKVTLATVTTRSNTTILCP